MSVLTIASQNLAAEAKSWQRKTFNSRLDDIADGLAYYHPAVFAAQETGGPSYLRKLDDTLRHLAPGRTLRRAPHGGRWRHLWYDPTRVKCLSSGLFALNRLHTKHAAWGRFRDLDTGKTLFITSVHLSEGGENKAQARYSEAERLLKLTRAKTKLPQIHAGDFNSLGLVGKVVMQPRAFVDGLDVADTRKNPRYNTFNGRTTVKTPSSRSVPARREHLDHIYVSASLTDQVNHWSQRVTPAASDHNIIAIKVAL